MPQVIEVPGQGMVEFPDNMSDADIVNAIRRTSVAFKLDPYQQAQMTGSHREMSAHDSDFLASIANDAVRGFPELRAPAGKAYEKLQELAPAVFGESEMNGRQVNRREGIIPSIGHFFSDSGRAMLAGAADTGLSAGSGEIQTPNFSQVLNELHAETPTPLPTEQDAEQMTGAARFGTLAAHGAVKMLPRIAASVSLAGAGMAPSFAAALPMAVSDEGKLDPIGAAIAAGLPGVSKWGERVASDLLTRLPVSKLKFEWAKNLGGELYPRLQSISQKIGGVEFSSDTARKFFEKGGGLVAANAYLMAANTPQILSLPPEERAQATLDMVAASIGPSLMAFSSRAGEKSAAFERADANARGWWQEASKRWRTGQAAPKLADDLPSKGTETPANKVVTTEVSPIKTVEKLTEETPSTIQPAKPEVNPVPTPPEPQKFSKIPEQSVPESQVVPVELPQKEQMGDVVLGKPTFIKGANNTQLPAQYAWLPLSQIEASHGSDFANNPNYAPLKNTRDYNNDPAEQEKVLLGAHAFDPESYSVNVKGAGEGPLMVAPANDGRYRVLGGNGRKQMLDRLTPAQQDEFGRTQDNEAAIFGLPPRPSNSHVLVRLLAPIDVASTLVRENVLTDVMRRNMHITVLDNLIKSQGFNPQRAGWFGIAHKDRQTFRLAEDWAKYQRDNADTLASSGLYVTTPVIPGGVPQKIKVALGGMSHVKPVEMPELVKLVKAVMGEVPKLKKMAKARGTFRGLGDGVVTLDPRIFVDEQAAAKTLAHEIGHWMDYMPHHLLKRGNVLGRIYSLSSFLKNKFGHDAVTNKEYRQELLDLTRYWKPYDADMSTPGYVKYRESAVELYADAISVLLNSPGLLEQRAPKFYKRMWEEIDRKPEVRDALFGLQDFLSKGAINKLESRENDLLAGFAKGETAWKAAAEERKRLANSFGGLWTRLWQELYWNHFPSEQRAVQVEKAKGLAFNKDPRVFLDDLGYKDVRVMQFGRTLFEKVIQPLEAANLTLDDAGKFLFLQRVMTGDRNVLANPLGFTPSTARAGLLKMRLDLGMDKMTLLQSAIDRFHDEVFNIVKQATDAGAINRTVFDEKIAPNRRTYASFAVLDHLDDWIPPGVKAQIGTFKEIANPFQATVLKTIGTIHLVQLQLAKNQLVDFLNTNFPGDLVRSPLEHEPRAEKGKGVFMRLEDGKPVWYHSDPYIADSFSKLPPRTLEWMMKPFNWAFKKVYPLIITYNTGFGFVLSPVRDMQRTTRNMPGVGLHLQHKLATAAGLVGIATGGGIGASLGGVGGAALGGLAGGAVVGKLFKRFGGTVGETARRYTGAEDYTSPGGRDYTGMGGPLIREMEANLALTTPFDHFVKAHRDDFMAELLKRMRVLPDHDQQGFFKSIVWKPVRELLDDIELGSMTLDQSLKVEAYQRLRARGLSPRQAAHQVRNYVGLPNIQKKGVMVRVVKPLVPFWNVFTQGWRADIKVATNPNTAAGWWLKYMFTNGLARMLLAAAATGAIGAAIKEYFDGISEYYKTNYLAIPVGVMPGGDFEKKVMMITIPEDETARAIGAVLSKVIRMAGPDDVKASGILDFGMGQFPTFNPAITVPNAWSQALIGNNPLDPLRGKPIIPSDAFTAGGLNVIEPMAGWTLRQSGLLNFFRYDPKANTTTELNMSAIPGANKFLRVTDQGYREQQESKQDIAARLVAVQKLKLPNDVQSIYHEFYHLQSIKEENRTPAQEQRYEELQDWHKHIYRPAWESIQQCVENKQGYEADILRKELGRDSESYYKSKK